jgi:hypothetical protein
MTCIEDRCGGGGGAARLIPCLLSMAGSPADPPRRDRFGAAVATVGDVDGDGARDVVVSGTTWRGCLTGVAVVVSPKAGTSLRTFTRASIAGSAASNPK